MKYLLFVTLAVGALIACSPRTTEVITADNSTEETTVTSSSPTSFDETKVDAGKALFADKCISCHYGRRSDDIPGLVDSFSEERWDEILPKMIDNAKLNAEETEQINQYIYWEISN